MKQNYQKMLEETIAKNQSEKKVSSLLLHSCCAPCSSYCLEYLSQYFKITVFYYNPNIYPEEEYTKRVAEQQHFIERLPAKYAISFVEGNYDKERFYQMAQGLENVKEGGERCFRCYEMRLRESAEQYGIAYLNSDFKKKNGYKRSVELSEEYGMYRQYYCGCVFSKRERDAQIAAKAAGQV